MNDPVFTIEAFLNIEETGIDWRVDRIAMRDLGVTPAELLDECLKGADADRVQGWRDYVDALVESL